MRAVGALHERLVHRRRVDVLASRLAGHIPLHASVVDIGAGDGAIAARLSSLRPDISIRGFDVLARPNAAVPVELFDGRRLPCEDKSADVALLVDVVHHAHDPRHLLGEAARVARLGLLVKDHVVSGLLAVPTLRLMDWIGNSAYGVHLPFSYWTVNTWQACFRELGLQPVVWDTRLSLYPWPASLLFDRSLHVITWLTHRSLDGA